MSEFKKYDFIIAGAGCAGLSLLVHMIASKKLGDKKILLIDKDFKNKNDRTWCFWEKGTGIFEPIVYKSWNNARFRSSHLDKPMALAPYTYKLIRGIDLYTWSLDLINKQENIEVRYDTVETVNSDDESGYIIVNGQRINAAYIFNSILFEQPLLKRKEYFLLQHFRGWVIDAGKDIFDVNEATLMDFRVSQQHGTCFVYVMPFSASRALVEYTLFTKALLAEEQYESALKEYISTFLGSNDYSVLEKEAGVIPMTNHVFPQKQDNIIYTGTAGGQTKASSGYTFQFIQKHSAAIVKQLTETGKPFVTVPAAKKRFNFYDSVLLNILYHDKLPGDKIFTTLFKKNQPQQVLRFLDNESSLRDELRIISSLPTWPFMKAALQQL